MSMSPRGSQTPSSSEPILTFRHGTQETLEAMLAEAMNTPLVSGPSTAKSHNWADVVDEARNILLNFDNCWPNTTATMPVVEEPSTVEDLVEVRARYRILFDWPEREENHRLDAKRRFDAPLLELIERGQREGGLDPEVPARWILIALAGLTRRALKGYTEGEVELDAAKQLARRGLLRGFGT